MVDGRGPLGTAEEAVFPPRTLPATLEPARITSGLRNELAVECSPLNWAGGEEDVGPLIARVEDG